jgi:hypothetical protein
MGDRTRTFDWSVTALEPAETWPDALILATGIVLQAATPMAVYWGSGLVILYTA